MQSRVTLLLIAACTMAFAPVALAQTLAEAFAYTEARKIVEVRVHVRSKPGGRGWAVTGEERGIEYCYIVTPFHVIGDEVTRTEYSDIVVEGAGYRLRRRAQRIADDGRDLALLLLDREGSCPFIDGPTAGRAASGLWLVRLSDTKVREEIEGDARAPIAPASENLDIASLTIAAAGRADFTKGWSGATVFRDGRRIGMVVEAADEGATARFYTAQGIFRALRDQIAIYERHDAVVTAPPLAFDIVPMDEQLVAVRNSNVRAQPTVQSTEVDRLPAGATVDVTGRTIVSGATWYRVALAGGGTGYVFGDLLKEAAPTPVKPAVGSYERRIVDTFRDCPECPLMVVVPAGSFMMGSPDSEEGLYDFAGLRHRVTISQPFAVGRYEVTFDEWDICAADGGCGDHRPDDAGWGRGRRPVINVSWNDAKAYVAWLSRETGKAYRLLSEAEWEYAARAGTRTRYSFGDEISKKDANFDGNLGKTSEVGSYPANPWELHDMHGNVWEWVEDCWKESYEGAPTDGSAWTWGNCAARVLRGGAWGYGPRDLRSAFRLGNFPRVRIVDNGFRVARTLP